MLLKKMNQYSKTLLKINPMWRQLHQGSNHYLVQTSEWLKSSWKHKDLSINAHNSLPEANASLISKLGQCRTEEGKLPNNLSGNGCINLKPSPKTQKKNNYQVDFISCSWKTSRTVGFISFSEEHKNTLKNTENICSHPISIYNNHIKLFN